MAIIQISRIQMRRGLSDNVPQLASAELGWAINTRKLYIGNGTLSEGAPTTGNTEILTVYSDIVSLQNTYSFKGEYDNLAAVQTGPDLLSPVTRSMQSKLDDIVNARDFGAQGDGSTNNVDILNRAIDEIYRAGIAAIPSTEASKRRTIHLPAGVYNLTGDVIRLLPYVKLKGDGKNSTFIVQTDPTQTCVAMTVDAADQSGIAIGSGGATKPIGLQLEDMTLINQNSGDVLILDSVNSALIIGVACQGDKTAPTSTVGDNACVRIITNAPATVSNRICFEGCDFLNQTYAIQADSAVDGVSVYGGTFTDLAVGVSVGGNSTIAVPSSVKVSFSVFDRIAQSAVIGHNEARGLVSAFNHYKDVGNDLGASPGAFPVVKLDHSSNYSIADQFDRTPAEALVTPTVDTGNRAVISTLPGGILSHGKYNVACATDMVLLDNQAALVPTGAFTPMSTAVTIDYSLTRGGFARHGIMKVVQDGTNIAYDDEYVQTGEIGVTLSPVINGNTVELNYTSTPYAPTPRVSVFKAAIKYLARDFPTVGIAQVLLGATGSTLIPNGGDSPNVEMRVEVYATNEPLASVVELWEGTTLLGTFTGPELLVTLGGLGSHTLTARLSSSIGALLATSEPWVVNVVLPTATITGIIDNTL